MKSRSNRLLTYSAAVAAALLLLCAQQSSGFSLSRRPPSLPALEAGAATAAAAAAPATTAAAQPGKITAPGVAASRLYNAWRRKNRLAALSVATDETVNKLFGVRWRPMRSRGCRLRDEGGFQCIYYDAKSGLSLAINVGGGASAGYGVESVSFSSEE
jgi:lipoprotein-anchoring transpeptidase ErfK/SrfK